MGNVVQYLKDPALVRRVQEAMGVREISIEVERGPIGAKSAFDSQSSSSAEEEAEENLSNANSVGKVDNAETNTAFPPSEVPPDKPPLTNGGSSLSWLSRKARTRRRIPTPPPQLNGHVQEPSSIENIKGAQTVVIETNSFIDIYFRLATELGYEPFYITFLPFVYWNIDTYIGRYMVITWCFSMYIGQGAKQLFKIKRPASPPAIRLEHNPSLETEYGFPSTHATVGTTIPFCLAYNLILRYEVPVWFCVLLALAWYFSVVLSRLYLGVHSVLDMAAGTSIAIVMLPVLMVSMNTIEHYLFYSPYTGIGLLFIVVFLLYIYPVDSQNWSGDRGDTAAILGSSCGLLLSQWVVGPLPDDLDPGPFAITIPSISVMSLCIVRFVVGLLLLLPTRFVMKLLCYKLLPVIMPTHGVKEVVKRPLVELPYKIITYGAIGFNAMYLSKVVFEICGISRWDIGTTP